MIVPILLTIFISLLVFVIYTEYMARRRAERKCTELRAENKTLKSKNAQYHDYELKRLCRDNYDRGLEDGSKCDALYKSIISKYKSHEQITVMMRGETNTNERDDEHETGSARVYR